MSISIQSACQRPDPTEERKKYEQDLKEQIEAKKRAYEEARRKEKEDEEKLERRLREQQERMRIEYEEDDRKRRIKEEEVAYVNLLIYEEGKQSVRQSNIKTDSTCKLYICYRSDGSRKRMHCARPRSRGRWRRRGGSLRRRKGRRRSSERRSRG